MLRRAEALRRASALSSIGRAGVWTPRRLWERSMGIVPFKLADIGEGIAEVEVLEVHVKEGDVVEEFDDVMEVQSDKATVPITSRFAGKITKVYFSPGDIAPTGSTLVDIDVEGEDGSDEGGEVEEVAEEAPAATESATSSEASTAAPTRSQFRIGGKTMATPAVRRVARENNVDLSIVPGSGKDGRVMKEDVLAFVRGDLAPLDAKELASIDTPTSAPPTQAPPSVPTTAEDQVVPIRGLERAMVKSMTHAWATPHFGYSDEVLMDNLIELRTDLKEMAAAEGVKLSYLPIILKAISLGLREFPELNATVSPDLSEKVIRGSHNIGVAIDSPRGLIVPNVKDVQERSVFEIARELMRLQELAQDGKLAESDLSGGTFTLSNIGAIGGTYASPVIFAPQVAIGAIGRMQRVPRFGPGDTVVPAHIMQVSWAADHRVVDGATMARFSNRWKQFLETPSTMISAMR